MPSIPNLPVPINGMIKTYQNTERTFTRPYSAKTIFFYKLGDDHFQGVRIPVSKARYRTMEALLDDLSVKVPMYFGVRKVFEPTGRMEVTSIDELQHMGRYLCSSSTWATNRNIKSVEKFQGRLEPLEKIEQKRIKSLNESFTISSSQKEAERLKRVKTTLTPPAIGSQSLKQVLFTLNGMPNRLYRMQFRIKRMPPFEDVLKEVGDMLRVSVTKLFTYDGERILTVDDIIKGPATLIACQKHERPMVDGNKKLPPLGQSMRSKQLAQKSIPNGGLDQSTNATLPLPPLSPTKRRIKKQIRKRTVSRKRKKRIAQTDSQDQDLNSAIIRIQTAIRGNLARKKYQSQDSTNLSSSIKSTENTENSAGQDEQHEAAVKIQAAIRGHTTRKQVKRMRTEAELRAKTETEQVELVEDVGSAPPAEEREETIVNSTEETVEQPEPNVRTSGKKKNLNEEPADGKRRYNCSVFTGNRWAADTDSDLYIILLGENGDSDKIALKQNDQEPKFQQNQVDTFDIETNDIGKLKKVTVGHDSSGYGSGIFIERLVLNEVNGDMLQYVFPCSKWLDSSQVDGKLERQLNCAGYYNLKTLPLGIHDPDLIDHDDSDNFVTSRGRYRITLHCGKVVTNPSDAYTSVFLVCYGSYTHSDPLCIWSTLSAASVGSVQTFDVDCSNVGELYKIRFETENSDSSSVAWQLETCDVRDVDTNEEIHLICNKWMCKRAPENVKVLHPQLFRELPVIRIGLEPLPVYQYNVALKLSSNLFSTKLPCEVAVQLTGEFGDSGIYFVTISETNGMSSGELKFVIECVSLGRMLHISYSVPVENPGEWVAEGLHVLNDLYEKHNVAANLSTQSWLIEEAGVRESSHAPYLFVFSDSRTVEADTPGTVKRRLLLAGMEGLSTKMKEKKSLKEREKTSVKNKNEGKWLVYVTTGQHADAGTDSTPFLIVYGENGRTKPIPLLDKKQTFTPGSTCQFQVDLKDIGRIFKIRVRLDTQGPNPMWYLKKIKMKDLATGDELRFNVEMWLERTDENPEIAVELPAIWPDVPPLPSLLYQVTLHTSTESENETDFDVSIIIFGEKGDTGKRFLRSAVGTQSQSCFKPGNMDTFELEAVSVRKISKIQLNLEPTKQTASWFLDRIDIYDPESDMVYTFACNKWFSDKKDDKKLERSLVPKSVAPFDP